MNFSYRGIGYVNNFQTLLKSFIKSVRLLFAAASINEFKYFSASNDIFLPTIDALKSSG